MGAILILLATIGMLLAITAQWFSAKAAVGFGTQIRHELFSHIQKLSFSDIDKTGTATFITRITADANQVQNGVNMVLRLLLRSPLIVFGATIMAFTVDARISLVFVIAIPILALIIFFIMFITMPLYKKIQESLDKVLIRTRENLTGIRVIRAFNKEENEFQKFQKENQTLYNFQVFAGKISALTNPLTVLVINISIIAIIWFGAINVNIGTLSQGKVVALLNYMSQILVELIKFANFIILINRSLTSAKRINEILEIEKEEKEEVNTNLDLEDYSDYTNKPLIKFDNVSLTYKGDKEESLSNISFEINKGETIGIIGGTGSGKSSIVNLIPKFYDYTKGNIYYMGQSLKSISSKKLREKIGFVLQKSVLFEGSIRSNLCLANENISDKDLYKALEIAQAKEIVDNRKNKLDDIVEHEGKNFSGGQRQRLCIARALAKKPDILILDDSTSALDYATDAALRKSIKENLQGMTLIIVSQRIASVRNADKIIVMDDGKISDIGKHEYLLKNCDIYKEIYDICESQN